ncbi:hypothetical protein A2U01_0071669, partial [Trifolium medium]|nr:hypothetical protein [Trifolium medium]
SDEKENDPADKTIDDNTVVVDVDNFVLESPVKKTSSDSIAKRLRTRSGKSSVSTSDLRKEEKSAKKIGLKPQLYDPKKSWSKSTIPSEKNKDLKRKAPPS